MSNPVRENVKEKIATDLKQVKETGQLRTAKIREIVQNAVSQVASEFKTGSGEIGSVVKDAVSAVVESLRDRGGEVKEEVTASIEGAIEGLSSSRRQSISQTQSEVKQLQSQLDTEEEELQKEIDRILVEVEDVGADASPSTKSAVESAISSFKNSDEVALMKRRYAQLQAQLAILRANLAARYGGGYEEVQEHLTEAQSWYERTRAQAEVAIGKAEQQRSQLEEKMGEAGTAVARRERRIRQVLSELLQSAADLLREKNSSSK